MQLFCNYRVTLVERPHVWYMDDGQLSLTLCPQQEEQGPTRTTTTLPPITPTLSSSSSSSQRSNSNSRSRSRGHGQGQGHNQNQPVLSTSTVPPPITAAPFNTCCACDDAKYDVNVLRAKFKFCYKFCYFF